MKYPNSQKLALYERNFSTLTREQMNFRPQYYH